MKDENGQIEMIGTLLHLGQSGQMQHRCQTKQDREHSRHNSRSSSTTTITQTGTIPPAVARYDVVPIPNNSVKRLTSYQSPGALADGGMLGQPDHPLKKNERSTMRRYTSTISSITPGVIKRKSENQQSQTKIINLMTTH